MSCNFCKSKPVWTFTNKRTLCRSCFIKYFDRKVSYSIRKYNLIDKDDIVGIDSNNKLLLYFFDKKFLGDYIKIVKLVRGSKSSKVSKGINKFVTDFCLDSLSTKIISSLFNNDLKEFNTFIPKKEIKKGIFLISPFYHLLSSEIILYCKINKISHKISDDNLFNKLISSLEKEHPEIKSAIINSYLNIKGLK